MRIDDFKFTGIRYVIEWNRFRLDVIGFGFKIGQWFLTILLSINIEGQMYTILHYNIVILMRVRYVICMVIENNKF